uniref:ATP synthase F0 subunit 6 n=1 Tax=Geniotrigona thoracica TaxID=395500 RepID=UPI003D3EF30D
MILYLNLFESFDPSIYYLYKFQFNWMFTLLPMMFFYNNYWMIPSRIEVLINMFLSMIYKEFLLSMFYKKLIPNSLIFIGLMIYLMLMNFFSLFPYIFSTTSHLMLNLSISLSIWFSFLIFSLYTYPLKFFSHLVPYNSPKLLMNFMVIIEIISYLIRPMTLAIRLSSNLISGHLIIILLSNFMMNFINMIFFGLLIQDMLLILEISMSLIQAYVYSILLSLYFKESN